MDPSEQLKRFIERSQEIVVFTGAGISTESGISDYRSQGGIWQRFQPVTIQEFLADEDKRILYWERKLALFEENKDAKPNSGHKAIVELEVRLRGIDTPEIKTAHGQKAKRFVTEILKQADEIVVKTYWEDKFGRYLVDVWVDDEYLNQTLLDNGLAGKY